MAQNFEFGLDTFGDITTGPDGKLLSHAQVIRNVIDEAVLADELGVNAFGVGEHHRPDFSVSAPEVVLAAIAGRTKRIHLGSAVTVLSTDDPIRVFQRFSTLNAASNGRAEITLGRGSFTESFPLFGYDLSQYEVLFEEKLDLFVALLRSDPVTWEGTIAPAAEKSGASSRRSRTRRSKPGSASAAARNPWSAPPITICRCRSPSSAATRSGFTLTSISISAPSRNSARPVKEIAVHSPGHVADTDEQAREEYWTGYKGMHDRIGAERGWPPIGRAQFVQEVERGSLYVGAPETVARKIAATAKALGLVRFD